MKSNSPQDIPATGTHNGILFGAVLGAVAEGVIGAYANRIQLKGKPTVDVYDRDLDG